MEQPQTGWKFTTGKNILFVFIALACAGLGAFGAIVESESPYEAIVDLSFAFFCIYVATVALFVDAVKFYKARARGKN